MPTPLLGQLGDEFLKTISRNTPNLEDDLYIAHVAQTCLDHLSTRILGDQIRITDKMAKQFRDNKKGNILKIYRVLHTAVKNDVEIYGFASICNHGVVAFASNPTLAAIDVKKEKDAVNHYVMNYKSSDNLLVFANPGNYKSLNDDSKKRLRSKEDTVGAKLFNVNVIDDDDKKREEDTTGAKRAKNDVKQIPSWIEEAMARATPVIDTTQEPPVFDDGAVTAMALAASVIDQAAHENLPTEPVIEQYDATLSQEAYREDQDASNQYEDASNQYEDASNQDEDATNQDSDLQSMHSTIAMELDFEDDEPLDGDLLTMLERLNEPEEETTDLLNEDLKTEAGMEAYHAVEMPMPQVVLYDQPQVILYDQFLHRIEPVPLLQAENNLEVEDVSSPFQDRFGMTPSSPPLSPC